MKWLKAVLSFRGLAASAVIASVFMMVSAIVYFQHIRGLPPCPLCVIQRAFVILIGLVGLAAFIHNPATAVGRRIYLVLATLPAAAGVAVAGRHVWLQSLPPDKVPGCGPGLEYMLNTFPFFQAMELVFTGSGECADVQWSFLGLSIPAWTLICFLVMLAACVYGFFTAAIRK